MMKGEEYQQQQQRRDLITFTLYIIPLFAVYVIINVTISMIVMDTKTYLISLSVEEFQCKR